MELTRRQFKEILVNHLQAPNGLNHLVKLVMEILMEGERDLYKFETGDVSNGYRPRRLITHGGVLELRVPRTRKSGFIPVVLALLKNQRIEMEEVAALLYSCGNTMRDISRVFEILYGKAYSTSQIGRLAISTKEAVEAWRNRPLSPSYEMLMIDATYLPVRRGDSVSKEAFFAVMGLHSDGSREILGVYNNPTEGSWIWHDFFADLKARGVREVGLVVSDGLNGIEEVAERHFPGVEVQLCTLHLRREIGKKLRPKDRAQVAQEIKEIFDNKSPNFSPQEGIRQFKEFAQRWGYAYPFLLRLANGSRLPYYFTFLKYEPRVRSYIHSTNWIERFNKEIKKGTHSKGAFPSIASAIHLVASIARHASYLKIKIGNLTGGLKKLETIE